MKQEDAERVARECLGNTDDWNFPDWVSAAQKLARAILSGDMRREIENAAYERVLEKIVTACQAEGLCDVANTIRALIQPPAQKENGE